MSWKRSKKRGGQYAVGYGKPPVASQFKKGQSGNPMGRRVRVLTDREIVRTLANSKIPVTIDGKPTKITRAEAFIRKMYEDAMRGNPSARRLFAAFLKEHGLDQGPVMHHVKVTLVKAQQRGINGEIIENSPENPKKGKA